jgi:hypothetical protein
MSRKNSHESRSSLKKARPSVPKSSSCDGLQMAGARFEKSCVSRGISVPLTQYARSKNIELNSPMSRFLNWSLCLTLVEERLVPRSRVCACLDPPRSPLVSQSRHLMPSRLTIAVLMLDIETEWTLNASLTTSSSYRKCSKRRTLDHSAQATSLLPIEGTTKCSPIALGSGSGSAMVSAAEPSPRLSGPAKPKARGLRANRNTNREDLFAHRT